VQRGGFKLLCKKISDIKNKKKVSIDKEETKER
jgi:hypothetical protein